MADEAAREDAANEGELTLEQRILRIDLREMNIGENCLERNEYWANESLLVNSFETLSLPAVLPHARGRGG